MRFPARLITAIASSLLLGVALSAASARAQSAYVVSQANGVGLTPGDARVSTTSCADPQAPNDDCVATVNLPFAYTFYGQTFQTAVVSTNGVLQFSSSSNDYGLNHLCLPLPQFNNAIFAHWTDLQTNGLGEGIYVSTTGDPGSRVFNIEWRASYNFLPPGSLNFEIRLYENQQRFDIVYGSVGGSGANAPGSGIATPAVGAQAGNGSAYTLYSSSCAVQGGGLRSGLALTFTGTSNGSRFIAGRVTDTEGNPLGGVTVSLSGDSAATAQTGNDGRYSFDNLTGSYYSVSAAQGASAFYPGSRAFGDDPSLPFYGSQIVNFVRTPAPAPGDLLISEFRFRGPDFVADEYVELYNSTNSAIVVNTTDGTSGWLVQAGDASPDTPGSVASYIIPRGTVIPARAHFLLAGSNYSSLFRYAVGEDLMNNDIPDGTGVAVFSTSDLSRLDATTRLDAAGFTTAPALYREGAGLPPVGAYKAEHSFVRRLTTGLPQDTNDNASDFVLVSTAGDAPNGVQSVLGAPGPKNLYSAVQSNSPVKASYIDPACAGVPSPSTDPSSACARVRVSTPVAGGANGTLLIRRRWTNRTGASVNSLRFRVVDITTLGNRGAADADLRALSSSDTTVTDTNGLLVDLRGLTLENGTPSQSSNAGPAQPNGGGLNSSLRAGSITLTSPLAPGQSINLEFRLGVQTTGFFRFIVNVEARIGAAPPSAGGAAAGGPKQTGGYSEPSAKSLPKSVTKQ